MGADLGDGRNNRHQRVAVWPPPTCLLGRHDSGAVPRHPAGPRPPRGPRLARHPRTHRPRGHGEAPRRRTPLHFALSHVAWPWTRKPGQAFAAWYNLGVEFNAAGQHGRSGSRLRDRARRPGRTFTMPPSTPGFATKSSTIREARSASGATRSRATRHGPRSSISADACSRSLKLYDDADRSLLASLLTNPDQPDTIHHWIGVRTKACAWPILRDLPGLTKDGPHRADGRALAAGRDRRPRGA